MHANSQYSEDTRRERSATCARVYLPAALSLIEIRDYSLFNIPDLKEGNSAKKTIGKGLLIYDTYTQINGRVKISVDYCMEEWGGSKRNSRRLMLLPTNYARFVQEVRTHGFLFQTARCPWAFGQNSFVEAWGPKCHACSAILFCWYFKARNGWLVLTLVTWKSSTGKKKTPMVPKILNRRLWISYPTWLSLTNFWWMTRSDWHPNYQKTRKSSSLINVIIVLFIYFFLVDAFSTWSR